MEDFNFVEMIRLVIGLVEHRCDVSFDVVTIHRHVEISLVRFCL